MDISELLKLFIRYPKAVTDSRNAGPDSIFFALKGDRFDGNDFAAQALQSGCAYAIVDKEGLNGEQYITVNNVLQTLQDLAGMYRKSFRIPVIGITGTNGKTTTKELMKCVLSSKYRVYATSGNLNNHIGVPLTLLGMPKDTEIAIIEMGASHLGEIAGLCNIAQPNYGLITNIGKGHLEGFGSIEGVQRTKKELYDYLGKNGGTIFYNEHNHKLIEILPEVKKSLIGYGIPERSSCSGEIIAAAPYLQMKLNIGGVSEELTTHLAGAYNFENVLAAVCVGNYFDTPPYDIATSIQQYVPQNNRSQIQQTANNSLLIDYYNANPTSMQESLNNFFKYVQGKMVILGDMFELGDTAAQEHSEIVNMLLDHPDVTSIVVGANFYQAAKSHNTISAFGNMEDLRKWLAGNPPKGQTILIKGSRGMRLEQLQEWL